MRSNALFQTRMPSRFRAGVPHRLICQMLRLAARADATGKEPRLGLFPAPVVTQRCEQFGAQWHIAILTTFAFSDMNHHAFAVDILDAKPDQFAPPDTSRVQQHEHDTCLGYGIASSGKWRFSVRTKKNRRPDTCVTTVPTSSFRSCSRCAWY